MGPSCLTVEIRRKYTDKQHNPAIPPPLSHLERESQICREKDLHTPRVKAQPTKCQPSPKGQSYPVPLHKPVPLSHTKWRPSECLLLPKVLTFYKGSTSAATLQPEPAPALAHFILPATFSLGLTCHFNHTLIPATRRDFRRCPPLRAHASIRSFCRKQSTSTK